MVGLVELEAAVLIALTNAIWFYSKTVLRAAGIKSVGVFWA